jgi:hypothetical protein
MRILAPIGWVRGGSGDIRPKDNHEAGDFDTVENLAHEDYSLTGAFPKPADKSEFLQMIKAIKAGFPDLAFNFRKARSVLHGHSAPGCHREEGGHARGTGYGHHKGREAGPIEVVSGIAMRMTQPVNAFWLLM